MSTARHHAEWLALTEIVGPFLSLEVLLSVFPQGLESHDSEHYRLLKQAYQEWTESQRDPAIHRVWIDWVLQNTLEYPAECLRSGQEIPPSCKLALAEHQLTLSPDRLLVEPETEKPLLLIQQVGPQQKLEGTVKNERWSASPATRMIELLRGTNHRLGLLTNGEQWMLIHAPKGGSTSLISWYGNVWVEEKITVRSFRSLLGIQRFLGVEESETLTALLEKSKDSQQEVTDQLGFQVRKAVEILIQKFDRLNGDLNGELLAGRTTQELYEAACFVMMRLVFLLCAEERGLLLQTGINGERYDQNYAVSTLQQGLRQFADQYGEEILERNYDAWCRLLALFRGVHGGAYHELMAIPARGGDLFDPDKFPFLEGRFGTRQKPIQVDNRTVLHLLESLQILQIKVPGVGVEPRRLSFKTIEVEQIGHVYEGLLDHQAVRAETTILGLTGTKNKDPEIALEVLEQLAAAGEDQLLTFLKKETGRSVAALKKSLGAELTLSHYEESRYLVRCGNDPQLWNRIKPFYQLIRLDTYDYPLILPTGTIFVTSGTDRRESGTHYTPKVLTEEIVKYTLEPLVYRGVSEGLPPEQWVLLAPGEILNLKICDPTMGSGAFLVQVCRYLGERLLESWARLENPSPRPSPTGEGVLAEGISDLAGKQRQVPPELLRRAKELRQNQTPAEKILWECLRDRRLGNAKFRRQHNIDRFIADFYCHASQLVIELDGSSHDHRQQEDQIRDEWFINHGFQVLRFRNGEVFNDLPSVLQTITNHLFPISSQERGLGGEVKVFTVFGNLSKPDLEEPIIPDSEEERLLLAKRLIAERCIYGVDKNAMAVEMAKLSLWLETLQRDKPFTFVDHALRCGDSLVGATVEQLKVWSLDTGVGSHQLGIGSDEVLRLVTEATAKRQELEGFTVNSPADQLRKTEVAPKNWTGEKALN